MKFRKTLMFAVLSASIAMASVSLASIVESSKDISSMLGRQREIAEQVRRSPDNLTEQQRETIRQEQAKIYAITEGKATLADLTPEERVRVVNAIEKIDAAIAGTRIAEDNRLVCRRERNVGSQLSSTRCSTRKQIDGERQNARSSVERGEFCDADCRNR